MADVADDGVVLHLVHVLAGDDVDVAGAGDEDVAPLAGVVHGHDLVAFHARLQGADRIDLGDEHGGPGAAERLGAALADVAVAAHHGLLAADHHVGGPLDAVDQALPAAVEIVELALGDAIVDVDGREQQRALLDAFIEAMDAGGGFLGDADDVLGDLAVEVRMIQQRLLDGGEQDRLPLRTRPAGRGPRGSSRPRSRGG